MIYLDHNASTPLCPAASQAMHDVLEKGPGNPSSIHGHGRRQRALIETQRRKLAKAIGAKAAEITFTSGATSAIHLGLNSLVSRGDHVLTTGVEHPAVLGALSWIGADVEMVPVDRFGRVEIESFLSRLRADTKVCVLMKAHNELGNIFPSDALAEAVHPMPVFSDSVQALGRIPLSVEQSKVSAMAFSAHKVGGPKGIGALWLRSGIMPRPTQMGGGQEQGRQAGTENVLGIAGFGGALDVLEHRIDDQIRQASLRNHLEQELQERLGNVSIHGDLHNRLANTLHFRIEGVPGEVLLQALDLEGVSISSGSACSSGALEPSETLLEMGFTREEAMAGLRVSMGPETTMEEIETLLSVLGDLVHRIRRC